MSKLFDENKAFDHRKVLLSFSGGLDSTYLLEILLNRNFNVETFYVSGSQCSDKIKAELAARAKILTYLQKKHKVIIEDNIIELNPTIKGKFIGVWPDTAFSQPMQWIYGALQLVDGKYHQCLAIAYVAGDQINRYTERLERIWDDISIISKVKPVPLEIPLWWATKQTILKDIDSKLLKMIWVCETPAKTRTDKLKACGRCVACVRNKIELAIFREG